MKRRLAVGLLLAGLVGPGCQAVGNYLANRARDFSECGRVQVGVGQGLGAGMRFAGLFECGLGVAAWNRSATVGLDYGDWLPEHREGSPLWDIEWQFLYLRACGQRAVSRGRSTAHRDVRDPLALLLIWLTWRESLSLPPFGQFSFGLFPAVLATRGGVSPALARELADADPHDLDKAWQERWVWSPRPSSIRDGDDPPRVWAHAGLHAFDCEAWAMCGIVGIRAGFSPGEALDFVLGWFGLDIAGDDRPLRGSDPR